MKIDAFLYNDEYDLLEIRLKENWDYFDKFILIEGDRYFNGKKRESIKVQLICVIAHLLRKR